MKTIVKQALLLSIILHSNSNTSFYSNIMELSKSYNLPNFVPNNLDKTKISRYKDIMKQKYITQWRIQLIIEGNKSFIIRLNIVMKFQVI